MIGKLGRLGRGFPIQPQRKFVGGGGGGNSNSAYYPMLTSVVTATVLWGGGDLVSQALEMREHPEEKFQSQRFTGVLAHGTVMGGFGNFFWYNNFLDPFVRNQLKLSSGFRFVASKIGLEIAIWHPWSLFCYWVIVGIAEGSSWSKIRKELSESFFATLACDVCLWTPMDILTFTKIPVHLQTTFINTGALFEAVALSYIHKHGFGNETQDDKIHEKKSLVASKHRLAIFDRFLNIEKSVSPEELRANISLQFALLDTDHTGFLTLDELKGGRLLPGIDDLAVNDKIAELLHRRADDNGDGRVSQSEYTRLVLKFHEVGYRKSFVADAVLAVFDENGDGLIDAREMKSILRVFGCDHSDEAVREAIKACDTNGDGKVSSEELATVLKAIKVDK